MGRRSVVADDLFSVRLQEHDLACAADAPARGALLAEDGRCCAEIIYFKLHNDKIKKVLL